jgi:hypothetical protein
MILQLLTLSLPEGGDQVYKSIRFYEQSLIIDTGFFYLYFMSCFLLCNLSLDGRGRVR